MATWSFTNRVVISKHDAKRYCKALKSKSAEKVRGPIKCDPVRVIPCGELADYLRIK